ncbi:39S ribosomal protein L2, mitochondrial-like [Teleopsis dalmanni]|uniref:39S ribosomal protein L2, mitochondrial-like n=1 Tax=Teleopsis dalmanni TaxID=139649 RepID=UPI0018CEA018|nr:39S ribosomal protein L2, mitochondrial-like [Teleopsis dalmanni]
MNNLTRLLSKCVINNQLQTLKPSVAAIQLRYKCKEVVKPKPGNSVQYRRIVHYKDEYTVEPLKITHLAGRDPVSGRVVAKGIGGGEKHNYHWVKWVRDGPTEGPPRSERVVEIIDDGCRTAKLALVGVGDELKYIIATENMKAGDIIKTSRFIPRIPVRPNEGDAYPLGALPLGTRIHCLEKNPGHPMHWILAAGTYGTILRKFEDKVVVQLPSKREFAFDRTCMATVGRVSNVEFNKEHIGSPQRLRQLGYRPRSGLWQRKTGKHGRKIRPLPPMSKAPPPPKKPEQTIKLTLQL